MDEKQELNRQKLLGLLRKLYDLELDDHRNISFRDKRIKQKMTAKDVAEEIGIGASQLSKILNPAYEGSYDILEKRIELVLDAKRVEFFKRRYYLAMGGLAIALISLIVLLLLPFKDQQSSSQNGEASLSDVSQPRYITKTDYDNLQQLNLRRLNYMAASEVLIFSANVRQGVIKEEDIDKEWDILAGQVIDIVLGVREEIRKMGYLAPNGQNIADLYELGYAPYSLDHHTRERFAERKSVVIDSERGNREIFETVKRESSLIQEFATKRIDSIWAEMESSAQK